MPAGKSIQGRDTQIRLFKSGNLVNIIEILNFNHRQDADFIRGEYLGNTKSVGDTSHKGWSGDFEAEVLDSTIDDLIDALIEQNLERLDIDEISLLEVENYRDGRRAGWVYTGVQLKYSKSVGSRSEKIRKKLEWQADDRKKVF